MLVLKTLLCFGGISRFTFNLCIFPHIKTMSALKLTLICMDKQTFYTINHNLADVLYVTLHRFSNKYISIYVGKKKNDFSHNIKSYFKTMLPSMNFSFTFGK